MPNADVVLVADDRDNALAAQSPMMRQLERLVAKVAPTGAAVLIRGEPGVGKELVARAIHRRSRRAAGPFVRVSCGAIRESQFEERLFGEGPTEPQGEKRGRRGLLELAHGGTLFLANVDCLPLWAQVELRDVLPKTDFCRTTSVRSAPPDVRVIASTTSDLDAAAAEGRFDRKLYYLVNVVAICVPPLRDRREDIRGLAERCLAQAIAGQGSTAKHPPWRFTPAAWELLLEYDWPGNLPELANVVAHAVAASDGPWIGKAAIVLPSYKPPGRPAETIPVPLSGDFQQIERSIIEEVVQRCRGNKAAAARALGLHRRTLYRILQGRAGGAPAE